MAATLLMSTFSLHILDNMFYLHLPCLADFVYSLSDFKELENAFGTICSIGKVKLSLASSISVLINITKSIGNKMKTSITSMVPANWVNMLW